MNGLMENELTECYGISKEKMYLRIAVCMQDAVSQLYLCMLSTLLTISDNVVQGGKGDKEEDRKGQSSLINCGCVQGTGNYCWDTQTLSAGTSQVNSTTGDTPGDCTHLPVEHFTYAGKKGQLQAGYKHKKLLLGK
jgi:hypothetical protein